jgi:hypothetical protein
MNILEEKLVNISKESASKGDEIVQDVKLLLAETASEERALLKSIGLSFDLNLAENKLQEQIIKKSANEKLDKNIVLGEDIKKMCTDYRLYMKPANQYTGTLPPTLGAELLRFCKEKNIPLPANSDYSRFYIIAPPKMFKGYLTPYQVYKKTIDAMDEIKAEEKRRREEDPILVYKLDEPGYYAIIKSWGNDFSWLRRVYGFFTCKNNIKNVNYAVNTIIFWLLVYGCYKLNWFAAHYHNPSNLKDWSPSIWLAVSAIITVAIAIIEGIWLWDDSRGGCRDRRKHLQNTVTDYERNAKY